MLRSILVSCIIGLVAVNAAAAEIVEIPLTSLIGTYGCAGTPCIPWISASFQLDRVPDTVYGVWIRLSGTVTVGQFWCDFSGWPPPYMDPIAMQFGAEMHDSLNSYWWNAVFSTLKENSTFQYQVQFYPHAGASWEFLASGRGHVSLGAGPDCPWVECTPIVWPVATVTEAVLVIEGDFRVSTRDESWGAIKSLFR